MIKGNITTFASRLTKLENSRVGALPAHLANFRPPKIIIHEGDDLDQIIKEMEARGEIPPARELPAGCIRVIVHTIVDWPKRDERAR
jgi:hypothetical protein